MAKARRQTKPAATDGPVVGTNRPPKQWYAIVLNEDRPIGSAPDPMQHWHKGDLYSTGTAIDRAALPAYFDVVDLDGEPRRSERWDPVSRSFVDVSDFDK